MPSHALRLLILCLSAGFAADLAAQPLRTQAERSGYAETGRYEEVVALCGEFARAYPDAVRCERFGTSPEGRPMLVLVASRAGALDAAGARERGLPVVLVQGGIHAGEIDGKDAGFLALRELLEGSAGGDALQRLVLLFVPVFNVDGHERFGAWNRPNQRGPREMGWRTTAQNLNLNRDYAKADAPEMQAMLRLVEAWDPLLVADLHVTDGAQFEHDVSIQVEPLHAGDPGLRAAGLALRDGVIASLSAQGHLPLPFYPSFVVEDDPASGFADGVAQPRFSTGYFQLRNRFAMLVETHSWRDYPHRVRTTRNTLLALLAQLARHGPEWREAANMADRAAAQLGGTQVALDYAAGPESRPIEFRGYAYTRTPSTVSGASMTRYDERIPQVWRVPLRDRVEPSLSVVAPRGGYLVPAAHAAWVGERLRLHGIAYRVLPEAIAATRVESFRASRAEPATSTFEGRQRMKLTGEWSPDTFDLPAGSLFVPIAQPRARLAMALLEPQAPDSLASWGGFNAAFEQKEYMEDYVAEQVAREMLAADPALRAEFENRLAGDAAFAADPAARLAFFHRRHASWDQRHNLYPVMRVDRAP
jgi:hypothetical protein